MSNKERVLTAAEEMARTFKEHSIQVGVQVRDEPVDGVAQGYVTDEGLAKLGDQFDRVPLELRAAVYESFVMKLIEEGYAYAVEQFKGTVH